MLLPWDIIIDLLIRLPAKSLLRFRCVSKRFLSLIDGKDFIHRHVNRSIETNSNLNLIVSNIMWKGESRIYSLSFDTLDNFVEIAVQFRKCIYHLIGSCNGLLALQNKQGTILLNPSTKEHIELHKLSDDELSYCEHLFGGFGYDVGSDDYKLVKIAVRGFPRSYAEVTVYSLKNNSCRKIKDFPYLFWLTRGVSGAFVNGALHWLAYLNPECYQDDLTIAFDLNSEEFYQVPMPLTAGNGARFMGVDVLGGCLSLVCSYDTDMVCDIFVMKDYGVKESWIKLFTLIGGVIEYSCDFVKAVAYSRSGDQVLVVDGYGFLYWYDIEKQRVESGNRIDFQELSYFDNGVVCVDSLVSLHAYRDLYWQGYDLERQIVDNSVFKMDGLDIC